MAIKTLSEIKRHNKKVGKHFFDRGNSPVLAKRGHYLVTESASNSGFVVYRYDSINGYIEFVDNKYGEYSWQPHKTLVQALHYIEELLKR